VLLWDAALFRRTITARPEVAASAIEFFISRLFATWRRQRVVDARCDRIRIIDAGRLASIGRSDANAESSVG
jgi:hypothetical protein